MSQDNKFGMSRRTALQGSITAGLVTVLPAAAGAAQAASIKATINVTKTKDPITKYIYGALIEHIGGLINYSLWSEVLDDRKFYYAVDSKPLQATKRFKINKWRPIGPDAAVVMDKGNPYVGDHNPVITLAGSSPRGIQQDGLSLSPKGYSGRIVIAGDPGAVVTATLIWGPAAEDRQSVRLPITSNWTAVPVKFQSGAETTTARIEIAGTGRGTFRVGATSLMPDDNLKGFRQDTIALLKALNSGVYRLPGGNFISGYDWQDAVGNPDKRPPIWDYAWNALQPNDVGTDELMTLCDLLGVEPYLCVNTGFGEPRSAAEIVEYVNGPVTSRFGKMRADNGHAEPYGVKYWNVGNEMYGYWQLGYMAPQHYVIKHNLFAKAMRKVDPSIVIIAVGAMPDEMTIDECCYFIDPETRKVVGKTVVDAGSPNDWSYRVIRDCDSNFEILSEHCYGDAHRFDIAQGKILPDPVDESVLDSCRRAPNRIRLKREYWEEYKKTLPSVRDGKIKMSVDEWGFRNARGLKQTLAFAMFLHEMFRCTDFITMAGFTMGTSWVRYDRTRSTYSNAGLLFKMYNQHFGKIPVEVTGNSPQPAPKWPVGADQPKVNAGSPTYPLDIAAALTEDRKTLTIAVVNATETAQRTSLSLSGFRPAGQGRVFRLTGPSLDADNRVGEPPEVKVQEAAFNSKAGELSVAPYSVELYEFPVA